MRKAILNIPDKYEAISITLFGVELGFFKVKGNLTTYVCNLKNGADITINEDGSGSQKPLQNGIVKKSAVFETPKSFRWVMRLLKPRGA